MSPPLVLDPRGRRPCPRQIDAYDCKCLCDPPFNLTVKGEAADNGAGKIGKLINDIQRMVVIGSCVIGSMSFAFFRLVVNNPKFLHVLRSGSFSNYSSYRVSVATGESLGKTIYMMKATDTASSISNAVQCDKLLC